MKRRMFLKVVGGSLLAVAGVAGLWGSTRTPHRALAPWDRAGSADYSDPRVKILSYAILAPNPHNRQPWMFELVGTDSITVHNDPAKMLPSTDPLNRQITVGYGCMLELLSIAAREFGYEPAIELFPTGTAEANLDGRPIASIKLAADSSVTKDPLFGFISSRRSNKGSYDTSRPVDPATVQATLAAARPGAIVASTLDTDRVARLRDVSLRAVRVEWSTPRCNKESVDLIRIGRSEIEANPDGISLPGPMMELLQAAGQLERDQMLDMTSSTFKNSLSAYEKPFATSMGFVWLASVDNTRASQIDAGRSWVRMNLAGTRAGLAMHPISQALQEYSEMAELYAEIHKSLAVESPATLQIFARIGYGLAVPASPRWPVEKKLRA